jgi:integrase
VSNFLRWCRHVGLLDGDPLAGIPIPREPRRNPVVLTDDQLRHLERTLPDDRAAAIVSLMTELGFRASDVANLEVGDVDFQNVNTNASPEELDRTIVSGQELINVFAYGEYTFPGEANITPFFEAAYTRAEIENTGAGLPQIFPGFLDPLRTTLKGQVYTAQMIVVFLVALYLGYRFTRKSI